MESAPIDDLLPTRQSLLGRLKDWDDRESWQEFFYSYWKLIYSVAIKAGLDDAAAQDVVQETVLAVAKGIRTFEYDSKNGSFKGWLLTVTRRRVMDHWRQSYRQPLQSVETEDESAGTSLMEKIGDQTLPWEAIWDEEWDRNLLSVALENVKQKVKSRQYQIYVCLALKEWPVEEIKRKLNASAAQIYFAKYKINGLLRSELSNLRRRWELGEEKGRRG